MNPEARDLLVEQGRVVEPFMGGAWVEIRRHTACGGCVARHGCGSRVLARWREPRPLRVAIDAPYPLLPGQVVRLGLPAPALTWAGLWAYGLPLGLALAAAILAEGLQPGGPLVPVAFLAGLGGGVWGLRRHLGRQAARYRPRLIEALPLPR